MPVTKFRSLNRKLLTSVSSITFVLALTASAVSFYIEFERAKSQTENMLNQLLDTVEGTASIAAYSRNQQIADDVINGLLKNDSVQYAKIMSDGGFTLEKSKNTTENKTGKEKEIGRILFSPFGDGQAIGVISVLAATKYNLVEAQHSSVLNAISSFSLIGLTSLVILLNTRRNFSKPLTVLSNSMHAIINGHEKRLQVFKHHENDELGYLINDVNNLLSSLDNKFNEERQLRLQIETIEQQLRDIFNSTSAGLFLLNEQGKLLTYNKTLTKVINIPDIKNLLGENFSLAACFKEKSQFETLLHRALYSGRLETQDFSLAQSKDSDQKWFHCLVSKVIDTNGEVRLEGVLFDVTDRVEHERTIKHEAAHDPLTHLLRRQAAQLAFENYISVTRAPLISFMLMDLDGFKKANDTHGHLAGDKVLSITAERLKQCVRSTDIVSRLGGDEFLIIMTNCSPPGVEFETAENIIHAIQKPMNIDIGTIIYVGISLGISCYKEGCETFEALCQAADEAMYAVKRQGKNGYGINKNGDHMNVKLIRCASKIDDSTPLQ